MMGGPNSPLPPPPRAEAAHSPYGPSSWYRVACPAALPTEEKARSLGLALEEYSDQADRGTERHRLTASDIPLDQVPEEHRWAVSRAREWLAMLGEIRLSEVHLPIMDNGALVTFGTGDHIFPPDPNYEDSIPVCADLKHGEGVPDLEALRWQMRCYAVGVAQKFDVGCVAVAVYHVVSGKEWKEVYRDIPALLAEIKARILYAHLHPDEFNPSPATCRWCKAKVCCAAFEAMSKANLPAKTNGAALTRVQLGRALEWVPLVENLAKSVREAAKALLKVEPDALPGWELTQRTMPRMKSEKTGETYTQTVLRKKNGGTE